MARRRKHLRLSESERQGGVAAELIGLLEVATADGILSDQEIIEIRQWLDTPEAADLPCFDYLKIVLEHVLSDGKITEHERKEVFKAVERILPPEMAQLAKQRRLAQDMIKKIQRQEERDREKAEVERNKPVLRLDIPVVGVPYENRYQIIRRYAEPNDPVFLVREPTNAYDPNAVMVLLEQGYMIGYVPREVAEVLAPQLDAGHKQKAWIKKIIEGSRYPTPYILVEIYHPTCSITGVVTPEELPSPRQPSNVTAPTPKQSSGVLPCLIILLIVFFTLALLFYALVHSGS
jgi:hypothetical protein